MSAGDRVVLRSRERLTRLGVTVALTAMACGGSSLAFLAGAGVGMAALVVVVLSGGTVAWCLTRARVVADAAGLADHRALRVHRWSWSEVAALSVDRPAGCWGGLCVRLHPRNGGVVDLLATRGYSIAPTVEGLAEVEDALTQLERLHSSATLSGRPVAGRSLTATRRAGLGEQEDVW